MDRHREDGTYRLDVGTSPEEAREIEAIVSLLRSLPDPEPEPDLTRRVMQRVLEIEAKPRLLRPIFVRTAAPRVAAVLAAGIACAALGVGLQAALRSSTGPVAEVTTNRPISGRALRAAQIPRGVAQRNQLLIASALPDARAAALFSGSSNATTRAFPVAPAPNLLDRRLDAQLNELQLDPHAFFRRLERVQERDRFVQRLAERAARRGDATQVALNVRAVAHPLARPMVDQFLHASLVRQVADR